MWEDCQNCLSELLCAVLFMTVVRNDGHTYEQFLKISVGLGLGLGLNFVRLFGFNILCAFVFWLRLFCSCVVYFFCISFSFFSTMPRDWL